MNLWQRRAQQKASEDRRKGAKQGKAIVDYMRRKEADKQREERLSEDESVAGVQEYRDETPGDEMRVVGSEIVPKYSPTSPPKAGGV